MWDGKGRDFKCCRLLRHCYEGTYLEVGVAKEKSSSAAEMQRKRGRPPANSYQEMKPLQGGGKSLGIFDDESSGSP